MHGGVMGAEVDHHRLGARFQLRHGEPRFIALLGS
jgi:hypothetical protein